MSASEPDLSTYVLAHGKSGRDRLRVLARVMEEGSINLIRRADIPKGSKCLDVGSGGGDVTRLLASHVGPDGHVTGVDFDPIKVEMAARETSEAEITNVEFRTAGVYDLEPAQEFDVIIARFVLSHLDDPIRALSRMHAVLRSGGQILVEDVEFSAHFCYPPCDAMDDYIRIYTAMAASTGGDANIGPKLPGMLEKTGFSEISMQVHQPAGLTGDVKMISPLTMHGMADRVVAEGLATREDVDRIETQLTAAAMDPGVSMSTPRVFQSWARKVE